MDPFSQYLSRQISLQFYPMTKLAFLNVLQKIPAEQALLLIDGLELMVLHEGAIAQVMHFDNRIKAVLQLHIPSKISQDCLEYIIAHELAHVAQRRNWRNQDGEQLEVNADATAEIWGFPRKQEFHDWIQSNSIGRRIGDVNY